MNIELDAAREAYSKARLDYLAALQRLAVVDTNWGALREYLSAIYDGFVVEMDYDKDLHMPGAPGQATEMAIPYMTRVYVRRDPCELGQVLDTIETVASQMTGRRVVADPEEANDADDPMVPLAVQLRY